MRTLFCWTGNATKLWGKKKNNNILPTTHINMNTVKSKSKVSILWSCKISILRFFHCFIFIVSCYTSKNHHVSWSEVEVKNQICFMVRATNYRHTRLWLKTSYNGTGWGRGSTFQCAAQEQALAWKGTLLLLSFRISAATSWCTV